MLDGSDNERLEAALTVAVMVMVLCVQYVQKKAKRREFRDPDHIIGASWSRTKSKQKLQNAD